MQVHSTVCILLVYVYSARIKLEKMTKTKKPVFITADRKDPPIYSMGFRFGYTNDGICTIDFLDMPNDKIQKVSFSVAITKKQAENLIAGLNSFIETEYK